MCECWGFCVRGWEVDGEFVFWGNLGCNCEWVDNVFWFCDFNFCVVVFVVSELFVYVLGGCVVYVVECVEV